MLHRVLVSRELGDFLSLLSHSHRLRMIVELRFYQIRQPEIAAWTMEAMRFLERDTSTVRDLQIAMKISRQGRRQNDKVYYRPA